MYSQATLVVNDTNISEFT